MPRSEKSTLPPVPEHTAEETAAQMVVKTCAAFLQTMISTLQALEEGLGYPEDSEDMGEGRVPQSVAFALRGTLECVLADDLEPALKALEEAADLTPEELYVYWQSRQAEKEGRK